MCRVGFEVGGVVAVCRTRKSPNHFAHARIQHKIWGSTTQHVAKRRTQRLLRGFIGVYGVACLLPKHGNMCRASTPCCILLGLKGVPRGIKMQCETTRTSWMYQYWVHESQYLGCRLQVRRRDLPVDTTCMTIEPSRRILRATPVDYDETTSLRVPWTFPSAISAIPLS
jgi:hypothetical protein